MRLSLEIRGRGRVRVAAYGLSDAEHLVEKELGRLWPEARVEVLEVRRTEDTARIVEEFEISFRVGARVEVEAPSRDAAPAEAFRLARGRLRDTRYARMEFEVVR